MSADCPRNIKVDLNIVRRGYVETFLLRKPTYQPSLHLYLRNLVLTRYCLPRDPGSFDAVLGAAPGVPA